MIGAPLLPAQCNRSERVHKALFRTRTEAKEAVFEYTEVFYDRHRLHLALGYCTPAEARASMEEITMRAAARGGREPLSLKE
jgi:transposase InsO family protein